MINGKNAQQVPKDNAEGIEWDVDHTSAWYCYLSIYHKQRFIVWLLDNQADVNNLTRSY